ncbi:MAG: fibronectin type III domain-containing protein [Oscillospiraceae bacterium]|nr:fibronectin type III domain-containing protein [Oscillospiraceae bacterium]
MKMRNSRFCALVLAAFMSVGYIALPSEMTSVSVSAATQLSAPSGLSVKSASGRMSIKWDPVKGAEAYRVYIYDTSARKWKKYKTVTTSVCSLTGLTKGQTYYFVLSALDKNDDKYTEGKRTAKIKVTYDPKTSTAKSSRMPALPKVKDYGYEDRTAKYDGKYTAVGKTDFEADKDDLQKARDWENNRNARFKAYVDKLTSDGFSLKNSKTDTDESDMSYKLNVDYKIYFNGKQVGTVRRSYSRKAEKGSKYKGGMRVSCSDEIYVIMK